MKPHRYTPSQKDFLAGFVPGHSHKEIMQEFNNQFCECLELRQISAYIKNNKLNTGRTGRFEKGHIPFNKGKKNLWKGGEETQFKKGDMPHNHVEVGTEVMNADGYWQVKVAEPNVWKLKHRLIWERLHGPIPSGHAIIFADQNRNNFQEDNLLLVSRSQLVRMNQNGLIKENADATKAGVVIAELITKTTEAKKRLKSNR